MSDALNFFSSLTSDGVQVITDLVLLQPGEAIVYHVGDLVRDRADPSKGYRLGGVKSGEIEQIAAFAAALAQSGRRRLFEVPVSSGITAYCAVGLDKA